MRHLDSKYRAVLLGFLIAALGCGSPGPSDVPQVEYAGCAAALEGPTCILPQDRRLTLWVRSNPSVGPVQVELDGKPVELPWEDAPPGLRARLDLERTSLVSVRYEGSALAWQLHTRPPEDGAWYDELRKRAWSGDFEGVREHLQAILESPPGPPVQARALAELGRLEMQMGALQEAQKLLERSIAENRALGRRLQEAETTTTLAYLLIHRAIDFARAREVLGELPVDDTSAAEAAYGVDYYRALLATETGDLRDGLRRMESAAERARRLDLPHRHQAAEQTLTWMLQHVGRGEEASQRMASLLASLPEELHPCLRASIQNDAAWIALLRLETGENAEDPTELLEATQDLLRQDCSHQTQDQINISINLALAHLHARRFSEARQALHQAQTAGPVPDRRLMLWILEAEARLERLLGNAEASLHLYDRMSWLADLGFSPRARWSAELGRAEALLGLERLQAALETFERAEGLLEEAGWLVAASDGRASFLARHERGARSHLTALLRHGSREEAFDAARRARVRALHGPVPQEVLAQGSAEDRETWDRALSAYRTGRKAVDDLAIDDWRLAEDGLRALHAQRREMSQDLLRNLDDALSAPLTRPWKHLPSTPEEGLLFLAHPTTTGWVAFVQDPSGLTAEPLPCSPEETSEEELADCLFTPFAERIRRAPRIRFLPYGPLRTIDLHALPFDGDVLVQSLPVVYGLDYPTPQRSSAAEDLVALLVADPQDDLPVAREEAKAVRQAHTTAGWQTVAFVGAGATGSEVLEQLPRVRRLHYAGHAVYAGIDGWESALPLADGTRLTVGDILTLEQVPETVVLSGCDTARSAPISPESLSLAHAFLLAGSHQVVAAVRPVADEDTFHLFRNYYDHWSRGTSVPEALRQAQLQLRQERPGADWSAFRVFEP